MGNESILKLDSGNVVQLVTTLKTTELHTLKDKVYLVTILKKKKNFPFSIALAQSHIVWSVLFNS